jgi:DNA-binding beta-propeller fold protein YncE
MTITCNFFLRLAKKCLLAGVLFASGALIRANTTATATVGEAVTFSVSNGGTAPFTYQWRKAVNGVVADISGATDSSYAIASVQASDAGDYSVKVSNDAGSTVSDTGTLAVMAPPTNDNFSSAAALSGQLSLATGSNIAATRETGEPAHAGNGGGASVWWVWTAPTTGLTEVDTTGSNFDTLLGVYTGSSVGGLTNVASDDDSGGYSTSVVTFNATAGVIYYIAVDGKNGVTGAISLSLTQPAYGFSTLAGAAGSSGAADGTLASTIAASTARLAQPAGVALYSVGNVVYVADTGNSTIRKISISGVSTLAGKAGTTGSADGTGTAALFNNPTGLAIDVSGNVYVADSGNNTIRKITGAGAVTIFAGTAGTSGSTDGTATAALFNNPTAIAIDGSGNLYVTDSGNNTIRKITSSGTVTTLAGKAGSAGSADGLSSTARFSQPSGVAVDSLQNVYVADTGNSTIRKVDFAGNVTTLAGSAGLSGSANGAGTVARFNSPSGVTVDALGNIFVADTGNQTLRKISLSGGVTVYTIGGSAGLQGSADGTGAFARFNSPSALAVDTLGNLYVADKGNNTVRASGSNLLGGSAGSSSNSAGSSSSSGSGSSGSSSSNSNSSSGTNSSSNSSNTSSGSSGTSSGAGSAASGDSDPAPSSISPTTSGGAGFFVRPAGVVLDTSGNLYVADANNHTIKKVTSSGVVSVFAGTSGVVGSVDGIGTSAQFSQPAGLAIDSTGDIYVTDTANAVIRKISPAGVVTTVAGSVATRGTTDGTGTAALFNAPAGIAIDGSGNLYVADSSANTVRKITPAGVVTTVAGSAMVRGETDGKGSDALFNNPTGIAVDGLGNLYVVDTFNDTIRKITPAGAVTTLAGSAGISGTFDGTGGLSLFNQPTGVAVDSAGNLFVADSGNATIRRISPAGVVTTIAGIPAISGFRDGAGSSALFNQPQALVVSQAGQIFVADTGNALVRKIASDETVSTPVLSLDPGSSSSQSTGSSSGGGSGGGGGVSAPSSSGSSPSGSSSAASSSSSSSGSSSGGGSMEWWFALGLVALAGLAGFKTHFASRPTAKRVQARR